MKIQVLRIVESLPPEVTLPAITFVQSNGAKNSDKRKGAF